MSGKLRSKIPLAPSVFVAALAWFGTLRIVQHYAFRTGAYDLSLFDYTLYYTLRGRAFWNPFVPESLRYNFSPALLAFLPLYLIDDGPMGLLLIQAGVVVASGIPLYLSARALLGHELLAAGLVVAYFGNPFLVRGLLYDFHLEMVLPAFFLTGLWLIEIKRQCALGVVAFGLAMLVKEDVPFYVAGVAVYFGLRRAWKTAVVLLGLSVTYSLFVWLIGLPYLLGTQSLIPVHGWAAYGETIPEILKYFLTHPGEAAAVFWARPMLELLARFGFLPVLAPAALVPAIPPLFVNLSSAVGTQRQLSHYYAAAALPFLAWATLLALGRVRHWAGGRLGPVGLLIVLLVALNVGYAKFYPITHHERLGHAIVAQIPAEASVATQAHIVPHLPKREKVYVLGKTWWFQPVDYVLFDVERGFRPFSREQIRELIASLDQDPAYTKVLDADGYVMFKLQTAGW